MKNEKVRRVMHSTLSIGAPLGETSAYTEVYVCNDITIISLSEGLVHYYPYSFVCFNPRKKHFPTLVLNLSINSQPVSSAQLCSSISSEIEKIPFAFCIIFLSLRRSKNGLSVHDVVVNLTGRSK